MKTTNNYHIIKEKLEGVDLPDMNKSWAKMDYASKTAAPLQGGLSKLIGKYKLYLNLLIAALVVGVLGLYVKSKTNEDSVIYSGTSPLTTQNDYLHFTHQVDHTNDLPLPFEPGNATTGKRKAPASIELTRNALNSDIIVDKSFTSETLFVEELDSMLYSNRPETEFDDGDLSRYIHNPVHFVRNQVGIKVQTGLHSNIGLQNVAQNTGISLFVRRYISSRTAIHVELGYNPIAITPITYVEEYNVFNNFNYSQKDSAQVQRLKYVTIPMKLYVQLLPKLSIGGGPQVSFLTRLAGDLATTYNYPNAPETGNFTKNTNIINRGGFSNMDMGFNMDLTYHSNRWEYGLQVQQHFGDYTTDQLGDQNHRSNTLQITASWLLNE